MFVLNQAKMKKQCFICKVEKDLESFHRNSKSKDGRHSYCNSCNKIVARKSSIKNKDLINAKRRNRLATDPVYKEKIRKHKIESYWRNRKTTMLHNAKKSLKKRGIICMLVIEDIVIPERCPIFNVPFDRGRYSPSLDRIDNTKPYTRENVWVISKLANIMKNDASKEELLIFCENIPKHI